jgi:mannose-6-phosphate isomerase-like protein (cupin superfamily)
MDKTHYYSKVEPSTLLHTVSYGLTGSSGRMDLTDDSSPIQVSRVALDGNKTVKPHGHMRKTASYAGVEQPECWIVMKGEIRISLFDVDSSLLASLRLTAGSLLITAGGAHSIDASGIDSEIIEIKMGPYTGDEKVSLGAANV